MCGANQQIRFAQIQKERARWKGSRATLPSSSLKLLCKEVLGENIPTDHIKLKSPTWVILWPGKKFL
jgi:hypothetical protein